MNRCRAIGGSAITITPSIGMAGGDGVGTRPGYHEAFGGHVWPNQGRNDRESHGDGKVTTAWIFNLISQDLAYRRDGLVPPRIPTRRNSTLRSDAICQGTFIMASSLFTDEGNVNH